jgi:peptidyl-prolyl cis-trans isomerase C
VACTLAASTLCLAQEPPTPQTGAQPQASQPAPEPANLESFPAIVARVNTREIAKAELLGRAKAVQGQMGMPQGTMPLEFYQAVLKELVGIELLFQGSKAQSLAATDTEVDQQFAEFKSQFPDDAAFNEQLAQQGVTPDELKTLISKDLSVQRLIETKLTGRVTVSQEAKEQFYEQNKEQMQEPEKLRLSHILISLDDQASDETRMAAKAKIVGVREEALGGQKSFSDLAMEYSDDEQTKGAGGEMTIQRGQTVPAFEAAAFALKPGGISEVIETRFGYHLLKLTERIPPRQALFDEVEPMIQKYLQQQGLQKEIESEVETLRSGASIEVFI